MARITLSAADFTFPDPDVAPVALGALLEQTPGRLVYSVLPTSPEPFRDLVYVFLSDVDGGGAFGLDAEGRLTGRIDQIEVYRGTVAPETLQYRVDDFALELEQLFATPDDPRAADRLVFGATEDLILSAVRNATGGIVLGTAALGAAAAAVPQGLGPLSRVQGDGDDADGREDVLVIDGLPGDFSGDGEAQTFTLIGPGGPLATVDGIEILEFADGTRILTADFVARPTLSVAAAPVAEGGSLVFTVTLDAPFDREVSFLVSTDATGTAVPGEDFVPVAGQRVVIPAGETQATVAVATLDNALDQPDRSVGVTLSEVTNARPATLQALGTILDDDEPPLISVAGTSVIEGGPGEEAVLVFTVSLDAPTTGEVSFVFSTDDAGTAVPGADFLPVAGQRIVIPAGETQASVAVTVFGNDVGEGERTVGVRLSEVVGAREGALAATGTILDDDAPTLSISGLDVAEGEAGDGTVLVFTVTLSAVLAGDVTFAWSLDPSGTAVEGEDFTAPAGRTGLIPAGSTEVVIELPVLGNALLDGDRSVVLALSDIVGAAPGAVVATATILDDEPKLFIEDASVTEGCGPTGGGVLSFVVTLNAAAEEDVTFTFETVAGTATAGADFTPLGPTTRTIAAGQTSTVIEVAVIGDALDEMDETLSLVLSDIAGATPGRTEATGTILDDEPEISISGGSVVEGDGEGRRLVYTVSLSAASGRDVVFSYATTDAGTATPGVDFAAVENGIGTIAAGALSAEIAVAVVGDLLVEDDETVGVALTAADGVTLRTAGALGTIVDDDRVSVLSISGASVIEGDPGEDRRLAFTVSLDAAALADVSFTASTLFGTADEFDFEPLDAVPFVIPAGQVSTVVEVAVIEDDGEEPNETLTVTLGDIVGAEPGETQATGTIRDDDRAPRLSIADTSVLEGDDADQARQLVFTVSLSTALETDVSFEFFTIEGTASEETDFDPGSGFGLIEAGQLQTTVEIDIIEDTVVEPNETVIVQLAGVTGVLVGRSTATGTIVNDDLFVDTFDEDDITGSDAGETLTLVADFSDDFLFDAAGGIDTLDLSGLPTGNIIEPESSIVDLAGGFVVTSLTTSGDGDDSIDGFENVIGWDLSDDIFGDDGNNRLEGRGGDDFLDGGDGDDILLGGAGDDILDGGYLGNDQLFGGEGDDLLFGGEDDDLLDGGAGSDFLDGDSGADTLTGGAGPDGFLASVFSSSALWGIDTVTDFQQGTDVLEFFGTPSTVSGGPAGAFASGGTLLGGESNETRDAFYFIVGSNTQLVVDQNDNGIYDSNDIDMQFNGAIAFTLADFVESEMG